MLIRLQSLPTWLLLFAASFVSLVVTSVNAQGDVRAVDAAECLAAAPIGLRPPTALKRPKVLTTAAGKVVDDYHWLRDDSHSDPEVLGHLAAENAYAEAALAQLQPLAAKLAAEMEGRLTNSTAPIPVHCGHFWYYERQELGQRFWRRYRRRAQLQQQNEHHFSEQGASGSFLHGSNAVGTDPVLSTSNELSPGQSTSEQLVLDPDWECKQALASAAASGTHQCGTSHSRSLRSSTSHSGEDAQHCEVYGSTVSPDGRLVAFGVDTCGGEQFQLLVRDIASGASILPAPIPRTSGDYEWSADGRALFYITRDGATNRPSQVWGLSLHSILQNSAQSSAAPEPLLLWQESSAAFYLTLTRSSSGRFLLLSSASEVTQQVLLLDLEAAWPPSPRSWLAPAARRHGVKQQMVGHWQSWLFLLVVSPETPNGELLVAPVHAPNTHTVLLPHRHEVELEDVHIFAHHLVLAERQLGHTTITVYCLPANTSAAALAACKYNSTAANAAEAQVEAAETAAQVQQGFVAGVGQKIDVESSSTQLSTINEPFSSKAGAAADVTMLEAALNQQLAVTDALPLLDRGDATAQFDVRHKSGTFVVIRGRAGSEQQQDSSPTFELIDPAVVVQQQQQQQASQVLAVANDVTAGESVRRQAAEVAQSEQRLSTEQGGSQEPTIADTQPSSHRFHHSSLPYMGTTQQYNSIGSNSNNAAASDAGLNPPVLSPDNSWQVAFEEDAYSVRILDSGDWATSTLRLAYTSFTTPHTVLDIDMRTQRRTVRSVEAVAGGFRPSDYRSYRLWATAADGVEVPMSLVYRLDSFGRDGNNPALLMVYGAYGTKYDPEWDSRLLSLLDRGWVVGIVHVRGGGELGYGWHAAGRLDAKKNSFNDLLAAAATLVQHNLTSASRLAVWGRSAGGLTAAAAINSAPTMFHAALLDVPFLDVLGDLVDAGLPLTVKEWDEWGDPLRNATQAALIASYSPVHNVQRGVRYPHMLVTAGLMDKRVGYWEAAKWVAQLRAAVADTDADSTGRSIQQHEPYSTTDGTTPGSVFRIDSSIGDNQPGHHHLLLQTDMSGGHFSTGSSGSSLDVAFKYAFLIATLPGCGSPLRMTRPDAQQQYQPVQQGDTTSSIHGLSAVLQALPAPLHRLLAMVAAAGIMTVLWHASRTWWPLEVSTADLQATLDMASSCEPCTPGHKPLIKGAKGSNNSSSSIVKTRRASTASTNNVAGDRQHSPQQRLSLSTDEAPVLAGCVSPPADALSYARRDLQLCNPAMLRSGQLLQQQQRQVVRQHAVVFAGLMDDWLLELTSAVPSLLPDSSRGLMAGGSAGGPPGPLPHFLSVPGNSSSNSGGYNFNHQLHLQQQLPLYTQYSGTGIGTVGSSSGGNIAGLFLRAER